MKCDRCTEDAVWDLFAAYSLSDGELGHGYVMHYPAPMARACSDHLTVAIADDEGLPASTGEWLVRPTVSPFRD